MHGTPPKVVIWIMFLFQIKTFPSKNFDILPSPWWLMNGNKIAIANFPNKCDIGLTVMYHLQGGAQVFC